jgi:hypothetical protein
MSEKDEGKTKNKRQNEAENEEQDHLIGRRAAIL